MRKGLMVAALMLVGCTAVDETEHCVETRYGKVVNEKMGVGLQPTVLTDATCFTMTERTFPSDSAEKIVAQTQDPVTVVGEVVITYKYDPATVVQLYREKRTPNAAETEILNGIREGYRNALASWTISEIFTNRANLADSVRSHIQRKVGKRAIIVNAFVRNIEFPKEIENARIAAAQQAQVLDKAMKQRTIDSVNAMSTVMKAEATAKAKQLEAESYATNPKLLDLEIAKYTSKICEGTQTCVLGGSAVDVGLLRKQ